MTIAVWGTSHKTSSVGLRERLSLKEEELLQVMQEAVGAQGGELLGLVTCNRTEFYLQAPDPERLKEGLIRSLEGRGRLLKGDDGAGSFYWRSESDAVRHLFRVAASLDSLVVGEAQILGQVKEAYGRAAAAGLTGATLNRLFQRSFVVAKQVRSETDVGARPVSVPSAAVELARKIFTDFSNKGILLVGSGEVARLALQGFREYGARRVMVTSRTLENAQHLANSVDGTPLPLAMLGSALEEADIVLTSLDASERVIDADAVRDAMGKRRHRPILFLDLAMPRNIDPAVHDIFNIYLYHVDDLKAIIDGNLMFRVEEAQKAEAIVDQAVEAYYQEMRAQEVSPTIATLTAKFEEIRRREVDRALAKMNGLGSRHREVVEACTTSIIQKILHEPIIALKSETSHEGRNRAVEFLKKLFGL